jgi:hypothetical protein
MAEATSLGGTAYRRLGRYREYTNHGDYRRWPWRSGLPYNELKLAITKVEAAIGLRLCRLKFVRGARRNPSQPNERISKTANKFRQNGAGSWSRMVKGQDM